MADRAAGAVRGKLVVVLVGARNPLNIGAAARAMSNFGFDRLRIVNSYRVSFREAKSAVGGATLLKHAQEFDDLATAVSDCHLVVGTTAARNRQLDHELLLLQDGASLIRKGTHSGNVALLFGSEKRGLSNRDFSYCHWLMRIPASESSPSMNLGQAVAVCLYELAHQPLPAPRRKTSIAAAEELDRLASILLEALDTSGYTGPRTKDANEGKIRRLVRRLHVSPDDTHVLEGMLRQMLWKMRRGR